MVGRLWGESLNLGSIIELIAVDCMEVAVGNLRPKVRCDGSVWVCYGGRWVKSILDFFEGG